MWHDPTDEPLCEVPFDFSFEREDSTNGMRRLIVDEVTSFRQLVRQNAAPTPAKAADLPPAPPQPQDQAAGVGPAFSSDMNNGPDVEEHPGNALDRELGEHKR